jgi:hypothetical protein
MSLTIDIIGSKDLIVGEIDLKQFTIERNDKAVLTVTSATYIIYSKDGDALTTSANATITNNATALVTVSADISAGTNTGERYVEFSCVIGSYTKKVRLKYEVKK